jgi:hypothetical protein
MKRETERFTKTKEWSIAELEMSKKHHEQDIKFQEESMKMREDAFEMQKKWMGEERKLDDQNRALRRAQFMIEQKESEILLAASQAADANIRALSASLANSGQVSAELGANIAASLKSGTDSVKLLMPEMANFTSWIGNVGNAIRAQLNSAYKAPVAAPVYQNYSPNPPSTQQAAPAKAAPAPAKKAAVNNTSYRTTKKMFDGGSVDEYDYVGSFADGGYTGLGAKHQSKGLIEVHGSEYVVPQQGALVVRGDNGSIDVLKNILSVLQDISNSGKLGANITINQQQREAMNEGISLFEQSFARVKRN